MAAVLAVSTLLAVAGTAGAAQTPGPGWEASSRLYPTHLAPGETGIVVVQLYDIGKGESKGTVTMIDSLPPGLEATSAGQLEPLGNVASKEEIEEYEAYEEEVNALDAEGKFAERLSQLRVWNCSGGSVVTCHTGPGFAGVERPIETIYTGRIGIVVKAVGSVGTANNHVTVSGGGAATAAETSNPFTISSTPSSFGLAGSSDAWFSNPDGSIDTQAGSHPFDYTFGFSMNVDHAGGSSGAPLRNLNVRLPAGIVGDPHAVTQCTRQQYSVPIFGGCPASSQVGEDLAGLSADPEVEAGDFEAEVPVYNLVPPPGVPAEFGFTVFGTNIILEMGVRSGSDYGITSNVRNIAKEPIFNSITLWGVPGESVHDPQRCTARGPNTPLVCGLKAIDSTPRPLLTLPTACGEPLTTAMSVESWDASLGSSSENFVSHEPNGTPVGITGCERLAFPPALTVAPDTFYADTPAGLTVDVKVPQEGLTNSEVFSSADIKNTSVTLPEGVAINPGQAAGLAACGPGEDGSTTPAEEAAGEEDNGPAHCPNASQVGTDEIETPLLSKSLKGDVYVMDSDPPHVKLLVTASGEGVFAKLVGNVSLDESTGRLTTTFEKTPELPFTDFKLSFSGGAQAALTTPTRCGTYTTTSDFTSWGSPLVSDATPTSSFQVTAGTGGGACLSSGPLPFSPSMIAGSTTDQAGGYTSFSLLLTRGDDQQRIGNLQFKTPEGLLGMISKVPLCPEPQASEGTCASASQIGHTVVEAGPGPYPLVVPQPGQPPAPIYLTGGYKGAPYGLSIVVPLHVGPFTLQTQVVRAKIEVDPLTTQLTVTTDALPQIIDGVPADLRAINAVIDKPGFMFNPTGCEPGSFSGTATGAEGASAPISSHFQMGSCRSLTFKPNFKVSTSGKTSRKDGASLDAKIVYPTGELGANQASSQSNVKMVKVDLPKQLPSRLTTLQKACPSATFEANPASCPEDSRVGTATAITPVLPVTLTGPAYFVSYGGAKFPELVVVLQGYGVTVYLHGETFISKAGITSSTFRKVPDVPITSFELQLPEGPYSALAANGNLCATKLKMPTAFTGQNGAVIKQSTPISVTGCTKAKHKKAKAKKKGKSPGQGHKAKKK